jgi:hypothetical protein
MIFHPFAEVAAYGVRAYRGTRASGRALYLTSAVGAQRGNVACGRPNPHIGVRLLAREINGLQSDCRGMSESGFPIGLASLQREAAAGRRLPPVEKWDPAHCGDIDIRIAKDGTWFHQGSPIGRKELVRLFSTILRKDDDGFHLVTPAEKMRIKVDDAPFIAVLMRSEGEGRNQRLVFTTNVGDETIAGAENPIRVETHATTEQPAPYVHVRKGLEARIARSVFYQLADLAMAGEGAFQAKLGVWSSGVFFPLGRPA